MANGIQTQIGPFKGVTAQNLSVTAGDAVIVTCATFGQTVTVTDDHGNTWVEDLATANQVHIIRCQSSNFTGTMAITVTRTGGTQFVSWGAFSWRGLLTSPVSVTAVGSGTSAAPASGATGSAPQNDMLVVGAMGTDTVIADTVTVPATGGATWTNLWHDDNASSTGAGGAADYQVLAAGGTASATWATAHSNGWGAIVQMYKLAPAPTVTNISPSSGDIAGGTSVTITGSGFQNNSPGTNSVTIKGVAATSVSVTNDTTLTCTTGAAAAGAGNVVVTNNNGTGTLTNGYTYTTSSFIPPSTHYRQILPA